MPLTHKNPIVLRSQHVARRPDYLTVINLRRDKPFVPRLNITITPAPRKSEPTPDVDDPIEDWDSDDFTPPPSPIRDYAGHTPRRHSNDYDSDDEYSDGNDYDFM
jgi:hypothetical protein